MSHISDDQVSPISSTSHVAPVTSAAERPHTGSNDVRSRDWIPSAFRWYFILIPTVTALAFGVAIVIMIWYSQTHHGLGVDNGSSAILFGWRFTPTLLAVLYTQLTVILFDDAKRTEPFARLAKAPSEGASAHGTILQTSRAWWAIFFDVIFKRKTIGKTSWCLLCSALINIIALLAISPLSSALLTSEELGVSRTVDFTRVVPNISTELPLVANRETYFRTMAALLRNISTSAWVTDSSVVFPVWPSDEQAQFGPNIDSSPATWTANTTTIHHDLDCTNMKLISADMEMKNYSGAYDVLEHGPYKGTQPMITYFLSSDDGCTYEIVLHPTTQFAYNGGLVWSNDMAQILMSGRQMPLMIGRIPFAPNITATSPYARLKISNECRGRDIIILTTPWTAPVPPVSLENAANVDMNQTYERSPGFRMKSLLCKSQYAIANHSVEVELSTRDNTSVRLPPATNYRSFPLALRDSPDFEGLALRDTWKTYFNRAAMRTDSDNALTKAFTPDAEPNRLGQIPNFSGMGPLLGALYSFNIPAMLDDAEFSHQAARVKGRFFAEILREVFTDPHTVHHEQVTGNRVVVEERVMVLSAIGIALAVLSFVSAFLLIAVYILSRQSCRPLNLSTDPSSAIGLTMLLDPQLTSTSMLKRLHEANSRSLASVLGAEKFNTLNGSLHIMQRVDNTHTGDLQTQRTSKDKCQPLVIQLRMLFFLGCFLVMVLVAVLVMNTFSARSRLSQSAFIYEADISKLGLNFSTFAPISIAPTVVSILVGLWWDQLDTTFRILQPFISLSTGPAPMPRGAGLTYRSKTWIGAAIKAARNKHFILFIIALGSVLCQILTVSMSALFERRTDNVVYQKTFNRTIEIRQNPVITKVGIFPQRFDKDPIRHVWPVLQSVYLDPPKNWLMGASIQLALNGSHPPWTLDEWNFVPIDVMTISNPSNGDPVHNKTVSGGYRSSNATFQTSSIRARLDCTPIKETTNGSVWANQPNLTDVLQHSDSSSNLTRVKGLYRLHETVLGGTPSNTSIFATAKTIQCCSNGSSDNPQTAAIGYWSPTQVKRFPMVAKSGPLSFVTKWIVGKPLQEDVQYSPNSGLRTNNLLMFRQPPQVQAAHCVPAVDIVDATVVVDRLTSAVLSYDIHQTPSLLDAATAAWSDAFTIHDVSTSNVHYDADYRGPLNISTSYGVLFMDSMLAAADQALSDKSPSEWEDVDDNAFAVRDQERGLNMDLMTYSMYALANKNPEALLDYNTLVSHANRTFQTFFQHFVSNGMSLSDGGLVYTKLGDTSYQQLGQPVDINGNPALTRKYPVPDTNRTIEVQVSNRTQILHLNPVATYTTAAILIWLITTTVVMACLQRKYLSSMVRDVQLIADVLILVAGSADFLALVQKHGVALKRNGNEKTMLGWFKGVDGQVRWGIEVIGDGGTAEWVDTPKQGWHILEKKRPLTTWLSRWRKN